MTKPAATENKTQIIIGTPKRPVVLSYPHLFEPHAIDAGKDPKYMTTILIDKDDQETLAQIKAAMNAALERGKETKWQGKVPQNLASPLHDGDTDKDTDKYPEFKGKYFINAKCGTDRPPVVFDAARNPITNPSEIYGGVLARVLVGFFPYDVGVNRGVACGLNGVQKVRNGVMLGGGIRPEDAFDVIEQEEEEQPFGDDAPWNSNVTDLY